MGAVIYESLNHKLTSKLRLYWTIIALLITNNVQFYGLLLEKGLI